jgi:hypothetical protein
MAGANKKNGESARCDLCELTFEEVKEKHPLTPVLSRLISRYEWEECLRFRRADDKKVVCGPCSIHICARCATPVVIPLNNLELGFWCEKCHCRRTNLAIMGFDYRKRNGKVPSAQIESWQRILKWRRQESILIRQGD